MLSAGWVCAPCEAGPVVVAGARAAASLATEVWDLSSGGGFCPHPAKRNPTIAHAQMAAFQCPLALVFMFSPLSG